MENSDNKTNQSGKKSFFTWVFDKLDKKLEEKAKSQPCCSQPKDKGGKSCCS